MARVIQYPTARGVPVTPPEAIGKTWEELFNDNLIDGAKTFIHLERLPDPEQCVAIFFASVANVRKETPKTVFGISILSVGMRISGRSSAYNLYYFSKSDQMYAECTESKEIFVL